MSLNDELDREETQGAEAEFPTGRVEWNDGRGVIDTGAIHPTSGFDPKDYAAILRARGLDPERFRITGQVGFTSWDQRARVREWSDKHQAYIQTGRFETVQLQAYRFGFEERVWGVDLPALYAEVSQTRPAPLKAKTGASTVVVAWADIQVGKVDELGGLKELLERLEAKRAALHGYLRRASFDHIVVADCGDIIEGFSNFPAQHRTNALSLMDQVDVAATEFWKTLRLCERHASVDVLSIPSNHCAWRRAGKHLAGKPTDDWGLHISKRLERHNEDIGLRMAFHRPADWNETMDFDIRGHKLGLAHGHQVSNPDQIKTWFTKMTHAGVLDSHVLLTGHFHFASLRPCGRHVDGRARWHIQAPTCDNGSSWVRNKFGEDGDPALAVFQMNSDGFDVQSFALL